LAARGLPIRTVLVASGKPPDDQLARLRSEDGRADHVAADLAAAADWILAQP